MICKEEGITMLLFLSMNWSINFGVRRTIELNDCHIVAYIRQDQGSSRSVSENPKV